MSNIYLTSAGLAQPPPTTSSPNSSIGYGSTGVLTINSTAGVQFCNNGTTALGATSCSISSSGVFNCNGLTISGPLTCTSLIVPSGGTITCLGSLICNSTLNMNNNAISNVGGLTISSGGLTITSGGLSCNGTLNMNSNAISNVGGLTISSGGLTITSGGLSCNGTLNMNSNAISNVGGLTISSGGLSCSGTLNMNSNTITNVRELTINTLSVNSAAWNCNATDSNSKAKSIWIVPNCATGAYNNGTRAGDYGIFWAQYITNNSPIQSRSGLVIAGHAVSDGVTNGVEGGIRVSGGVPLHVFGGSGGTYNRPSGNFTEFYFGTQSSGGKVTLISNNSATLFSSTNVGTTYNNVGIYSEGHIVSANYVVSAGNNTFSDNRIKTNIVDIDDVSAMATLRLIEPKKYNYIDTIRRGTEPVWGFIAQQVRSVLPYSTTFMQKEIPNIYDMGIIASDMITITLSTKSTTLFQRDPSDNLFPIYLMGCDNVEIKTTITSIIDDKTFIIADALTSKQISDLSQIFVYGSIVNDFHTLDKNAIFTIATAALQELDREYQATRLEVATLTTQVSNMSVEVTSLTSQNASLVSMVSNMAAEMDALIARVNLLISNVTPTDPADPTDPAAT